jgi:hypothetical protein
MKKETESVIGSVYMYHFASESSDSLSDFLQIFYKSDGDPIIFLTRKSSVYTRDFVASDSHSCCRENVFPDFQDISCFVSDWKSDRESYEYLICMQIGQRIGCRIVCTRRHTWITILSSHVPGFPSTRRGWIRTTTAERSSTCSDWQSRA